MILDKRDSQLIAQSFAARNAYELQLFRSTRSASNDDKEHGKVGMYDGSRYKHLKLGRGAKKSRQDCILPTMSLSPSFRT